MNKSLIKEKNISLIEECLKEIFSSNSYREQILLEPPINESFGDWTSNIAFIVGAIIKDNPRNIAKKLVECLNTKISTGDKDLRESIEIINIAGAGYINIKLAPKVFFDNLIEISDSYGIKKLENPLKIIVEMGDPNTHKTPHIGHLSNYIIGDSIARILEANGHKILKVNYQSDIGLPVAKCLYVWIKKGKPTATSLEEKVKILQQCYQEAGELYKDPQIKEEIQKINKSIYTCSDKELMKDWKETRQWSLDFYKEFEDYININQEIHYFESTIWERGLKIAKNNIGEGKALIESEGAVIFPGEKYGLHNRVFITSEGNPTYEAKDLGLIQKKMKDWPFDLTIIPTANEQNGYFNVLIAVIGQIFPELKGKMIHIGTGMVSLTTGKMGSRSGNILSAIDLVEMIEQKVKERINSKDSLTEFEKKEIVRKVTLSAIKYAFLGNDILKDSVFDINRSISLEGNSGPYLQYSFVRINSILKDVKEYKENYSSEDLSKLLNTEEELGLVKYLSEYPEIVIEAGTTFSPHKIATYLFTLAQKFNLFYSHHSVNSAESEELINARRMLVKKTSIVLKNGLSLLGIDTVEKM